VAHFASPGVPLDALFSVQDYPVCILFCTVTDDVLENVALNKPSYQVSTYTDHLGEHNASLANDGIVNTCARSQSETNPWWAVDLGVETLVAQVNVTNSGDNAGRGLHFAVYYFIKFMCISRQYATSLVATESVVQNLGICFDSVVSRRSHVGKSVSSCFTILCHLLSICRNLSSRQW